MGVLLFFMLFFMKDLPQIAMMAWAVSPSSSRD